MALVGLLAFCEILGNLAFVALGILAFVALVGCGPFVAVGRILAFVAVRRIWAFCGCKEDLSFDIFEDCSDCRGLRDSINKWLFGQKVWRICMCEFWRF